MTIERGDVDLAVEPMRPGASLGVLFLGADPEPGDAVASEVELAKTEAKEEASAAGKAAMLVVGAVAAVLRWRSCRPGWPGSSTT